MENQYLVVKFRVGILHIKINKKNFYSHQDPSEFLM